MRGVGLAAVAAALGLATAGTASAAVIDFTEGGIIGGGVAYGEDGYFVETLGPSFEYEGGNGWFPGSFSIDPGGYARVGNLGGFSSQPLSFTAIGSAVITVLAKLQVGGPQTMTFTVTGDAPQTFDLSGFYSVADLYFSADNAVALTEVNIAQQVSGIPEPATWAFMIAGFGLAGTALRSRRLQAEAQA